METAIVQALLSLGPGGIMCWVLLQQMKLDREQRQRDTDARLAYDKDRLEVDRKVAVALTALAIGITGKLPDEPR
jgi:hypothetical protein